jgi:hypothetical protein
VSSFGFDLAFELLRVAAMATVQTRRESERRDGDARRWPGGLDGIVAVLFVVLALGAMAEVAARRSTTTGAAVGDSSWQMVLRVGDEARERGDVAAARRAYLTALFRARGERSLAGVLSAAEGFGALGDAEVVERALTMAAGLDAEGPLGAIRLEALRDRLAASEPRSKAVHSTP